MHCHLVEISKALLASFKLDVGLTEYSKNAVDDDEAINHSQFSIIWIQLAFFYGLCHGSRRFAIH